MFGVLRPPLSFAARRGPTSIELVLSITGIRTRCDVSSNTIGGNALQSLWGEALGVRRQLSYMRF